MMLVLELLVLPRGELSSTHGRRRVSSYAMDAVAKSDVSVPLRLDHGSTNVGVVSDWKVTPDGLVATAYVDDVVAEVHGELIQGYTGCSVSYDVSTEKAQLDAQGRWLVSSMGTIREVSLTNDPSFRSARVLDRRGLTVNSAKATRATSRLASAMPSKCRTDGRRCPNCSTAAKSISHHRAATMDAWA